jgi:hypothetical protein
MVTRRPPNLGACLEPNMVEQDSFAREHMVQKDMVLDCMAQGSVDLNLTKVSAHAMTLVQAILKPSPRSLAVPPSSY